MKKEDKKIVKDILTASFRENKSTNFVIKQDYKKEERLQKLIEYSIFYGKKFGKIYLLENKKACAIIIDTSKKKTTFGSVWWDLRLIFTCTGWKNVKKVLQREALIKKHHPKEDFIHLWYIGVSPLEQGKGFGTELLKQIMAEAKVLNKRIYLETSTESNHNFYKNRGFQEVATINELGYSLKMYSL